MPNDAKLGLVLGVGLVIAAAVLFFRKEAPATATGEPAPAGIVNPLPQAPAPARNAPLRAPPAQPTARGAEPRRHTVREGDTLFSLSRTCYGDAEHYGLIYDANRGVLNQPDPLPVGAELVIPDLPDSDQNP